jgi:exosortase H (IPTLxxWG-CTERM-specific)
MSMASDRSRRATRRTVLRFLALFALLVGAFYALILWPPCGRWFIRYLEVNAQIANAVLRLMGQDTQVHGVVVRSPGYAIAIRRGCDGFEPAWIYASAVLAFPAALRRKVGALIAGVGLIQAANLVRIISLFFIGRRLPSLLPLAHLEVWPAALMIMIIGIWSLWVRALAGGGSPAP